MLAISGVQASKSSIPVKASLTDLHQFHASDAAPSNFAGSQGIMERPKDAVLDSVFGTTNEDEIVKKILLEVSFSCICDDEIGLRVDYIGLPQGF